MFQPTLGNYKECGRNACWEFIKTKKEKMEQVIVYVIKMDRLFMTGGESVGRTYSPQEFELEFNSGNINPATDVIRFINKDKVLKKRKEKV